MLISCNKLKSHIKDALDIDWVKIWDTFTIRTAEVEEVKVVGNSFDGVVVAQILDCQDHPDSDHMHVLMVDYGEKEPIQVVCGAPNVKVGLKTCFVKVGGHIDGFEIKPRPLRGVMSNGMCCSGRELGISENHEGILELPDNFEVGKDIKSYWPIEDVIVEIDNKSLTNRPDLWGHYGIAREIAAITKHELLPLEIEEVTNDKEDLDICITDSSLCYRYCGLTIDNIKNNQTPMEMQIFLHYAGMRSISLLVDLTNYLMLELGQPMHAFDKRVVKKIEVGLAKNGDKYITLDGVERNLTADNLMIKNGDKYFGIAGVMGGLDSEILEDTDSVFLESATFNAGSIRKTAVALGLRTEASARYEKSLDPNMAIIAVKRFLYLLKKENPDLVVSSNLTDIYPTKLETIDIKLSKSKLDTYMGRTLDSKTVENILCKIGFQVKEEVEFYLVTVPTFRASKDISIQEDLIEEIARFYGLENFEGKTLRLDLSVPEHENIYNEEYDVKYLLANKFDMHEVHSYIWYDSVLLKELGVSKDGIMLEGKNENNILRDDLSFSLLNIVNANFKYKESFDIFEIGTIIENGQNKRRLSVILAGLENGLERNYNKMKLVAKTLFKNLKNINIDFTENINEKKYYDQNLGKNIILNGKKIGEINVLEKSYTNKLAKKKSIITMDVDFDIFVTLNKQAIIANSISKYPEVNLDYTIITDKETKYLSLKEILTNFKQKIIKSYRLTDVYQDDKNKKFSIRFTVGAGNRTLDQNDLTKFREKFITYIRENGYEINE